MVFLKNLITAFLSTVVISVSFALYQYDPDVLEFSFETYLVFDFLYIGTVYLFVCDRSADLLDKH